MNGNPNNFNMPNNPNQNMNGQIYNVQVNQPANDGKGLASIIIGVITIVFSFLLCFITFPLGIVGLILGIMCKTGKKIAGIILNVIGIILSLIMIAVFIIIFLGAYNTVKDEIEDLNHGTSTYYTDYFSIYYDENWSEVTVASNELEGLMYEDNDLYFLTVGVKGLSEVENKLACNYESTDCQKKLYDNFYNYWNNDAEINQLFDGDEKFNYLKYNADYTSISYGESQNKIKGKLYLVVSKEKNSVICFISKSDNYVSSDDNLINDLLENMTIYQYDSYYNNDEDDDSEQNNDDNTIGGALNDLANWNRYKDLRTGNISHNKGINGGWRILSDSETYWVFKNNEFWWYKSVNDLNDNYWYGTTEIVTGKEGLKKAGLSEDRVDTIIKQSNGNVTENDIYTVICTPKKIISEGQDKSATNIPADLKWTYIWIVVDHGTEGIEAQVLNMQAYENTYYVKLND